MKDPDVFVVLKEGTSHGTLAGTPLCVDLDERAARMTKVGRCLRYTPSKHVMPVVDAAQVVANCFNGDVLTKSGVEIADALDKLRTALGEYVDVDDGEPQRG